MTAKAGDGRSRRQSKEETQYMLLETGRELLAKNGLPLGVEVRLTDVLAEHDLTTGAAYQIWNSQQAYQEDLALHIAQRFGWSKIGEVLEPAAYDATDPIGTVRVMSSRYFDEFIAGNDFFAAMRLWATGSAPQSLRQAVASGYRSSQQQLESLIIKFLDDAGLRLRRPFTPADLAVAWAALTEGFALRLRFDPTAVAPEPQRDLYVESMVGVFVHYTEIDEPGLEDDEQRVR